MEDNQKLARLTITIPDEIYSRVMRLASVHTLQQKRQVTGCDIVRSVLVDYFRANPRQITVTVDGEEIR